MSTILQEFKNPGVDSRGMFRCWFPDAGADLDRIANHVRTVYNAGFGGMEIAMVPQYAEFDPREYGWATPRWKEMLRTILRTASSLPEPFKIDLTITAHWPPAVNTIDPNHPAAQKELSYTMTKVTSGGTLELPMPPVRDNDDDAGDAAHFIFTDNFLAAVVGTIVGRKGDKYILAQDSMRDVSEFVTVLEKTTPAGIAEDETKFGSKPKLADVQHYYAIDLDACGVTPTDGETWEIGDTILFAYFTRGCGETLSGRSMPMFHLHLPMADKMYATDYYSTEGTDAIIDVWEKNILDDDEIRSLMGQIDGAIFEDSIELSCATIPWTNRFAQEFKTFRGYEIVPFLPILQSLKGSPARFLTDRRIEKLLVDDYYTTLNDLYLRDHVERIKAWTKTFGYKYRAQSYGGDVNTSAASCVLDVAEGESLGFGEMREYFRNISGGVHMTGRKYVSDEILADLMKGYCLDWKSATATLNSNWAAGVNRAIIHGMSYESEVSGKYSQWPGWHAFQNAFADPWGDRQTYWQDVKGLSGMIARTQAVLQGGKPQIDLAIYKGQRAYGWGYTRLLDYGYSYDIISNPHLQLQEAVVSGGLLCPEGPCYQALVIADQEMLPTESAKRLLELAKAGLTVIFSGKRPERANGAFTGDTEALAAIDEMLTLPNVLTATDMDDVAAKLMSTGIRARAAYRGRLEPICRRDESGIWYFLFNNGEPGKTEVTLTGAGRPVLFDPWTGSLSPLAFTAAENGVTVTVELANREAKIIALMPDAAAPVVKAWGVPIVISAFDTTVESWGPDPQAKIPTQSAKTTVAFGIQAPGVWDNLPATEQQLSAMGVDSMAHVAGRGNYSATVTLPPCNGAILKVTTGDCMVTGGTVNGQPIPAVNQRSGLVDLGSLVKEGENSLTLTISTTLINRLRISHPLFDGKGGMPAPPAPEAPDGALAGTTPLGMMEEENDYELPSAPMDMPSPGGADGYHYGLLSAELIPYQL